MPRRGVHELIEANPKIEKTLFRWRREGRAEEHTLIRAKQRTPMVDAREIDQNNNHNSG